MMISQAALLFLPLIQDESSDKEKYCKPVIQLLKLFKIVSHAEETRYETKILFHHSILDHIDPLCQQKTHIPII